MLTAVLTLLALIGYAVFYTMYLKRATPQNIVVGEQRVEFLQRVENAVAFLR